MQLASRPQSIAAIGTALDAGGFRDLERLRPLTSTPRSLAHTLGKIWQSDVSLAERSGEHARVGYGAGPRDRDLCTGNRTMGRTFLRDRGRGFHCTSRTARRRWRRTTARPAAPSPTSSSTAQPNPRSAPTGSPGPASAPRCGTYPPLGRQHPRNKQLFLRNSSSETDRF